VEDLPNTLSGTVIFRVIDVNDSPSETETNTILIDELFARTID
jgi:hypothetical protein